MVRPIGILAGLGFVIVLLFSFIVGVVQVTPVLREHGAFVAPTAEHDFHLEPRKLAYSFDGPAGRYDVAQLQRGFQVYKEVCSACHSMKQVSFRDLEGIGFSKAEVKAIAKNWATETPSIDPATGEAASRKPIPSDKIPSPYPNEVAARAANNNALPPDQSLIAKARHEGPRYIYSLLTGYRDPKTYRNEEGKALPTENQPGKGLHFNPYFPNLNLAMAPPLTEGQVTYADGTKATLDQEARDVSAFLFWAAEPKLEARHQVGWASLVYLLIFTALTYLAYRSIWADKKHPVSRLEKKVDETHG